MTIKLDSLKSDTAKREAGDWIEIPDLEGVAFRVRGFTYKPYEVARDAMIRRKNKALNGKPWPTDDRQACLGKLYAEHLLLGWRGFDVEFSRDRAEELLCDPAYRENFYEHVEWAIGRVGQAQVEFAADAAGNSGPVSATA